MKKASLWAICLAATLLLHCGGTKAGGTDGKSRQVKQISAQELSRADLIRELENQKIMFTARFGKIVSGFDFVGMEQYQTTHFLVSLTSEDSNLLLPHVLVPSYLEVLPTLKPNNLVQVEGVPHLTSEGSAFIVAESLKKL